MNNSEHVVTTYLEMTSRSQLRRAESGYDSFKVMQSKIPLPELNRFLYATVGREWQWVDRLPRTREQWLAYVDRPELETWVAYWEGTPAGYFELEHQPGKNIEIRIFGVMPHCRGKGFGGRLLSVAIERGWDAGANRVWLHTCNRDHPAALQNYIARGFRIFSTTHHTAPVGALPPWPG